MAEINQLPYFVGKNNKITSKLAHFILKKVKKRLKEKLPFHYLIFNRIDKKLKFIKETAKRYPYFLRFDILKYYPTINHQKLILILEKILVSRRGKEKLKNFILPFLKHYNIQNKGLPLGNFLSYVLAGVYLFPLDFKLSQLNKPFLRVQDDYLIFLKRKKEPERVLKEIIEPILNDLDLKINIDKLKSGRFHQDKLEFLGFKYFGGVFTISQEKIEEFKNKIIKITHLTKKKSTKAIIKQLNNKILGFGHYYKFALSKETFKEIDQFIRMRLRRYLNRNKDSKNKLGNLILTNEVLKSLGLKSLNEISLKYALKKHLILKKNKKNNKKTGLNKLINLNLNYGKNIDKSLLLAIFKELKEITKKLEKLEKKIEKNKKKVKGKIL